MVAYVVIGCVIICVVSVALYWRLGSASRKGAGTPSVSGTVWAGVDSLGHLYEYHFRPDGSMHYKSHTGFWKNGTWQQNRESIYMETNQRYSEYSGTIVGTRMSGDVSNVTGLKWQWTATKQ